MVLRLIAALLLISSVAVAQNTDQQSYCTAQTEQAKSQSDILRTPQALVGVTQSPLVGAPAQAVAGFTASIQNIRRSYKLGAVADSACKLYNAQEDLALTVQYLTPSIEQAALRNREQLDDTAIQMIDQLIATNQKILDAHNLSRPAMYALQTNRSRLLQDKAAVEAQLAAITIPVELGSLTDLITATEQAEAVNQHRTNNLVKTQNFDVQLIVGARHSLLPFANTAVGGYGGFTATWSPASKRSDEHLDNAERATLAWANSQVAGPVQQAKLLQQQLRQAAIAQHARLKALNDQQFEIERNQRAIAEVDSSNANLFRTTLESDFILLRVETLDAQFRITELERQ